MNHIMYPVINKADGVVYQCGSCARKIVILQDGVKVILNEGDECCHEMVEPIEPAELPSEFAEFFAKKGWE